MKKYVSLFCAMMMVGAIALPSEGAISFSSPKGRPPKTVAIHQYLDASNPELKKALEIHNLLNEMPDLADAIRTYQDLEKQKGVVSQQMDAMSACHAANLDNIFKEPKKVWGKMVDSYEGERQVVDKQKAKQKEGTQSASLKTNNQITREIMNKVSSNPSKWGETSKGASFASWKDQTPTFEKNMEQEYDMRLVMDSLDKGSFSVDKTTKEMQQDFAQRLSHVGVDAPDLDLSKKSQYLKIQKQLRDEKKKAIVEAQKYIALLEKQDAEHPELVKKRQDLLTQKRARMSDRAQQVLDQSDGIIQISQISPVVQQKLVVAALEKDKNALVYLTETNAMEVDQRIRERQAMDKIVKESQKQMETAYDQQLKNMPLITNCSVF